MWKKGQTLSNHRVLCLKLGDVLGSVPNLTSHVGKVGLFHIEKTGIVVRLHLDHFIVSMDIEVMKLVGHKTFFLFTEWPNIHHQQSQSNVSR